MDRVIDNTSAAEVIVKPVAGQANKADIECLATSPNTALIKSSTVNGFQVVAPGNTKRASIPTGGTLTITDGEEVGHGEPPGNES